MRSGVSYAIPRSRQRFVHTENACLETLTSLAMSVLDFTPSHNSNAVRSCVVVSV